MSCGGAQLGTQPASAVGALLPATATWLIRLPVVMLGYEAQGDPLECDRRALEEQALRFPRTSVRAWT